MTIQVPSAPAIPLEGGFYAGRILIDGVAYALIVAPKAEGERKDGIWIRNYKDVPAARSYNDGRGNTAAMAAAGSTLAQWAMDLRIGGFDDWYIPALDELEICYRYLKPGTEQNSTWMRSGINVSADPPTYPYVPDFPAQTANELFRSGGREAFDAVAYWSSSQHESSSHDAWGQTFTSGTQHYWYKDNKLRARAVRRLKI